MERIFTRKSPESGITAGTAQRGNSAVIGQMIKLQYNVFGSRDAISTGKRRIKRRDRSLRCSIRYPRQALGDVGEIELRGGNWDQKYALEGAILRAGLVDGMKPGGFRVNIVNWHHSSIDRWP